jgi:hypothetical protein
MRTISILTVLALCAGCGTLNPATFGKTFYKQSFVDKEGDTLGANGQVLAGQNTEYHLEIKAPAGVKLDDLTGAQYKWDAEHGEFAVNKSGTTDTTGQMEIIKAVVEAITTSTNNALSLAAPLVGQSIAGRQANEAASIQSRAELQKMIADIVKEALKAQAQPAPSPLTDIPAQPLRLPGTN